MTLESHRPASAPEVGGFQVCSNTTTLCSSCGPGDPTQGCVPSKQALYQMSHFSNDILFSAISSPLFCLYAFFPPYPLHETLCVLEQGLCGLCLHKFYCSNRVILSMG